MLLSQKINYCRNEGQKLPIWDMRVGREGLFLQRVSNTHDYNYSKLWLLFNQVKKRLKSLPRKSWRTPGRVSAILHDIHDGEEIVNLGQEIANLGHVTSKEGLPLHCVSKNINGI